jgi:hypothetical protein
MLWIAMPVGQDAICWYITFVATVSVFKVTVVGEVPNFPGTKTTVQAPDSDACQLSTLSKK